jgi:hypothetical protein
LFRRLKKTGEINEILNILKNYNEVDLNLDGTCEIISEQDEKLNEFDDEYDSEDSLNNFVDVKKLSPNEKQLIREGVQEFKDSLTNFSVKD